MKPSHVTFWPFYGVRVCVPFKRLKCFSCINIGLYRVLVEAIDSLLGSCSFGHDWELSSSRFTTSRGGCLDKVDLDAIASWVYQTCAIRKWRGATQVSSSQILELLAPSGLKLPPTCWPPCGDLEFVREGLALTSTKIYSHGRGSTIRGMANGTATNNIWTPMWLLVELVPTPKL